MNNLIKVYSKRVQAEPRYFRVETENGVELVPRFALPENEKASYYDIWNEYEDGSLKVKILYSGETGYFKYRPDSKPWAVFSVWGCDDIGVEIFQEVENDKEFNKLLSSWLEIYHEMPKHLTKQWCYDHGFVNA